MRQCLIIFIVKQIMLKMSQLKAKFHLLMNNVCNVLRFGARRVF